MTVFCNTQSYVFTSPMPNFEAKHSKSCLGNQCQCWEHNLAALHWDRSCTSKKASGKSKKMNSEASTPVKKVKTEIKGNDQVFSFIWDKKHFLLPSLKLNSWSKLVSYCALCNHSFLHPTGVILLLTGLFVEEKKFQLCILKCTTFTEILENVSFTFQW